MPGDRLVLGKTSAPQITCTFCEHSLNRTLTNAKMCIVVLWTFVKLFDTVPRDLLWQVLVEMGIVGRFMQCLQSMYSQDNVRIMHPTEGLSAWFSCGIGVKQGCPLSPLLFGLYLDGLEKHLDALDGDNPPQLANIVVKLLLYCRNPTLAKCGGEAQHSQSWGFGVLRDSRMFRVR